MRYANIVFSGVNIEFSVLSSWFKQKKGERAYLMLISSAVEVVTESETGGLCHLQHQ
jgi:hypothetical protein